MHHVKRSSFSVIILVLSLTSFLSSILPYCSMKFRRLAFATTLIAVCVVSSVFAQDLPASAPDTKNPSGSAPYKKCWVYTLQDSNGGTLVSSNGTVFFAEPDGRVRALTSKAGQVSWVTELGGNIAATLVVPKVGLAVITRKQGSDSNANHTLRLLNIETGLVIYSVSAAGMDDIHLLTNGKNIVVAERSGRIVAVDSRTGSTVWNVQLPGKLTASPAISEDLLVAATDTNKLVVLSAQTGQTLGNISIEKTVSALTIRENEMIVAGDERGGVTTYRSYAGEIWWRFKSGAKIGTIIETNDGTLVGSFDNFVYLLSNYSGDVKWKKRLDGRIISEPLVVGETVFVASSTEGFATGIDLDNGRPTEQLQFGENQFLMTKPVFTNHDTIVFGLTGALAGFSQNGCAQK